MQNFEGVVDLTVLWSWLNDVIHSCCPRDLGILRLRMRCNPVIEIGLASLEQRNVSMGGEGFWTVKISIGDILLRCWDDKLLRECWIKGIKSVQVLRGSFSSDRRVRVERSSSLQSRSITPLLQGACGNVKWCFVLIFFGEERQGCILKGSCGIWHEQGRCAKRCTPIH